MSSLLEIRGLVVSFGSSFSVGPMDLVADHGAIHLAGPNGGGKTSLLRAIAGELVPSEGRVRVSGNDVQSSVEGRRRLALVPSAPELPEFLTVREAYQFSASLRGSPMWDGAPYCQAMQLDPSLLLGVASAGQRRKAELICGLAADPAVLLLDETFAHLDEQGAHQLSEWVDEWSSSRVVVLAHHGVPPIHVNEVFSVSAGRPVAKRSGGK